MSLDTRLRIRVNFDSFSQRLDPEFVSFDPRSVKTIGELKEYISSRFMLNQPIELSMDSILISTIEDIDVIHDKDLLTVRPVYQPQSQPESALPSPLPYPTGTGMGMGSSRTTPIYPYNSYGFEPSMPMTMPMAATEIPKPCIPSLPTMGWIAPVISNPYNPINYLELPSSSSSDAQSLDEYDHELTNSESNGKMTNGRRSKRSTSPSPSLLTKTSERVEHRKSEKAVNSEDEEEDKRSGRESIKKPGRFNRVKEMASRKGIKNVGHKVVDIIVDQAANRLGFGK